MKRSPTVLLVGACVAGWAAGTAEGTNSARIVVRGGWDWTLPDSLRPVPYSGFVTWNGRRFNEQVSVDGVHLRWKQLNPAEGQYNWELLTDRIERSRASGMRLGLHLMGAELKGVPDWVMEKHDPAVFEVPVLQESQPWRLKNVAAWHPGVDEAFHVFLRAFGETGIAQSDDVVYGYIHGISPSRGEELWMRRRDLEMYEEQSGLTPESFGSWLRRRIDAMCQAFKGVEYKLAWMSGGAVGPTPAYRNATAGLWSYAFSKGAGIRGGGIDFMHHIFDAPAWSSRIDAGGYCVVDDADPTIAEGRFRGDENEEYGKYWEWRFGPHEQYTYRHRISSLRALQMRQNFQYVSSATLELNPDLNRYVLLTQGRRRETSPDAWAYLRECTVGRRVVRNMERWLLQRDLPGSHTVPAERTDRFALHSDPKGAHYDFDARRTDVADGQDGMLFRLDRVFWPRPGPAAVKVTYTDNARAHWHIRYTAGGGRVMRTAAVECVADGERKTATFALDSLAALGRFPSDEGFRDWAASLRDTPANLVENAQLAGDGEGWVMPAIYRIAADPDRPEQRMVEFRYKRFDDTLHMDQLVRVRKGVSYRVSGQVRNQGTKLRPAIRVARMDWSTLVYLEAVKQGEWEELSGTFAPEEDGTVRLQLFGQGRANHVPGLAGVSCFRGIRVCVLPLEQVLQGREMDFRIETEGPGDVTVTIVRVVKPGFTD